MLKQGLLLSLLLLSACTGVPEGLSPVHAFDAQRYLGVWYEVARLDHRFERGLEQVTAEYRLNPDGSIGVRNRGFNPGRGEWQQADGIARFVSTPDVGHLKVSFFGPFYGGYTILDLDADYRYALVSGPDRDYLWLLSRTPTLPEKEKARLLNRAQSMGFATAQLIWVNQTAR